MPELTDAMKRFNQARVEGKILPRPDSKTWAEALDNQGMTVDGLVGKLTEVLDLALYGYNQEKVTSKGEILTTTETDLKVAIAAIKELARIRQLADAVNQATGPREFLLTIEQVNPVHPDDRIESNPPKWVEEDPERETYDFT